MKYLYFVFWALAAGALMRTAFDATGAGILRWKTRRGSRGVAGTVLVVGDGKPRGAKVYTPAGLELHGIRSLFVDVDRGNEPVVSLEILSSAFSVAACPVFQVADPRTGHLKRVIRIEFEGGEVFDASEVVK